MKIYFFKHLKGNQYDSDGEAVAAVRREQSPDFSQTVYAN